MGIEAKKQGLLRILGMFLILIGFVIFLIIDFSILNNLLSYLFLIIIIIPWFLVIIFLKLEIEFIIEKRRITLLILIFRRMILQGLKIFSQTAIVGAAMKQAECKGDHQGHLCVLASNDQFEKIKELTQNPQYICFNCGRVADCDDNLCNPMSLKD